MIKELEINNFKSHKQTNLKLSNLTVLCGPNGVGKSSVLHPLLLLRESYLRYSKFDFLNLMSDAVRIGSVKDALYQFSNTNGFSFNIKTEIQALDFHFSYNHASELYKTLITATQETQNKLELSKISLDSLFNTHFQFISASRLGPQNSYPKDDLIVDIKKQISLEEGKAEYCIHFLEKNKDENVIPEICNSKQPFQDLFSQTIAWEREISEGININIKDIGNLGYELLYSFNTQSVTGKTQEFSAKNVGFGITYILPIIVAILSSKKDTLLIIENPEAHLHPNGIAKLTELICLASEAGIQIIVETHSDHIINGILVQCKKFENEGKGLKKDNVSIYYFNRDETEHCTKTTKIEVKENGRLESTPKGFFDQIEIDLETLMGF